MITIAETTNASDYDNDNGRWWTTAGIRSAGTPDTVPATSSASATANPPLSSVTLTDRDDSRDPVTHPPTSRIPSKKELTYKNPLLSKKSATKVMQSTTLRALRHARAPRRFGSTSSSSEAAQKKAQEALGAASAAAVRAGEYARSALGPFGARLSGLLGCPCPFSPHPFL